MGKHNKHTFVSAILMYHKSFMGGQSITQSYIHVDDWTGRSGKINSWRFCCRFPPAHSPLLGTLSRLSSIAVFNSSDICSCLSEHPAHPLHSHALLAIIKNENDKSKFVWMCVAGRTNLSEMRALPNLYILRTS